MRNLFIQVHLNSLFIQVLKISPSQLKYKIVDEFCGQQESNKTFKKSFMQTEIWNLSRNANDKVLRWVAWARLCYCSLSEETASFFQKVRSSNRPIRMQIADPLLLTEMKRDEWTRLSDTQKAHFPSFEGNFRVRSPALLVADFTKIAFELGFLGLIFWTQWNAVETRVRCLKKNETYDLNLKDKEESTEFCTD